MPFCGSRQEQGESRVQGELSQLSRESNPADTRSASLAYQRISNGVALATDPTAPPCPMSMVCLVIMDVAEVSHTSL
jgi:hypothetical protein